MKVHQEHMDGKTMCGRTSGQMSDVRTEVTCATCRRIARDPGARAFQRVASVMRRES